VRASLLPPLALALALALAAAAAPTPVPAVPPFAAISALVIVPDR